MKKQCPICNFTLNAHDEVRKEMYLKVHCHECGYYNIDIDCAKSFRQKYLCFDITSVGGRELYDHNMRLIRSYIARHHKDTVNNEVINDIVGLYIPRQ